MKFQEMRKRMAENNLKVRLKAFKESHGIDIDSELMSTEPSFELFKIYEESGFKVAALFPYYPKNKYPDLKGIDNKNRNIVWAMKSPRIEGVTDFNARLLALGIKVFFNEIDESLDEKILCCIPASTKQKTQARFDNLIPMICDLLGVTNGYAAISVEQNHDETKGDLSVSRVEHNKFDTSVFTGKEVILIDDVTTSGKSFVENAQKLIELGATNVFGVFLAKTTSKFEFLL